MAIITFPYTPPTGPLAPYVKRALEQRNWKINNFYPPGVWYPRRSVQRRPIQITR